MQHEQLVARRFISESGQERIDLTGYDLPTLIQTAYRLSTPRGLGFFQATSGDLPLEEAQEWVDRTSGPIVATSADYIRGRSVKVTVYRAVDGDGCPDGVEMFMLPDWFDHTRRDFAALLDEAAPQV